MKKLLKVFLGFLTLFILTAFIYFNFFFKDHLKEKISSELYKVFGDYYTLTYEEIDFNFEWKSVSINLINVNLKSDTTSINNQGFLPVFFSAKSLKISGFKALKLWLNHEIEFNSLELLKPSLQLFSSKQKEIQKKERNKNYYLKLNFDQLKIDSASFIFFPNYSKTDTLFNAELFSLKMNDISFNPLPNMALQKGIRWDSLKLNFQKIDFHPEFLPYSIKISDINYSSNEDIFEMNNCSFYPNKSLRKLAFQEKYQKVFSDIFIPNLKIKGFKSDSLIKDKIHVRELIIEKPEILLLKDKNKLINPYLEKMGLQHYLNKIKYNVQIDSILFWNATINTLLINKGENEAFSILINNFNGSVIGFKSGLFDDAKMLLNASGTFLGITKIWVSAEFPLHSHHHNYIINIAGFDFKKLNPLIAHFYPLEINKGNVRSIRLFGVCDDRHNNGFIDFEYDDLDLKIFKERKGKLKKATLISFAANKIVHDSNPRKGKKLQRYKFSFEKKKFQGPIILWIGGLAEGVKETILPDKLKKVLEKN